MKFSEVKKSHLFVICQPDKTALILYKNKDGKIIGVLEDLTTRTYSGQIDPDQEVQVITFFKPPKK